MTESAQLMEVLDARVRRREERRDFFRAMAGGAAVAAGAALIVPTGAAAQTVTDADILNFALNLEYLEAQFYAYAATGTGLNASLLGTSPGAVSGGRAVAFTDPIVRRYANEIAGDEAAHVSFLRRQLGTSAVAQPAIDISVSPTSAFSKAAQAAQLVAAGASFDPYASDENFLLGAFIFEDVGVTAYKGAAAQIANKTYLEAAAGILAVEAYHAAMIREMLSSKGLAAPSLLTSADAISNARDSLDGATDIDQGLSPTNRDVLVGEATTTTSYAVSNIVPADANGIVYSRTASQVLNIVYLTSAAASAGGFFPSGLNGNIKTSTAAA